MVCSTAVHANEGLNPELARDLPRLNSAAPYNTHAWPPINRALTWLAWIEERTVRIGFGIKRASNGEEELPELLAGRESLPGRQPVPFRPFVANYVFRPDHPPTVPRVESDDKRHGQLPPLR